MVAGWFLPLRVQRTDPKYARSFAPDSWSVVEDDGTLVAICGPYPDAKLIVEALNSVLPARVPLPLNPERED